MRILGIAHADSVHTHKWANYFAGRGHQLRIVSPEPPDPGGTAGFDAAVVVETWCLPAFHLKRWWCTLAALARLRRVCRAFEPDLLHAHYLGTGAWYAALVPRIPLAVTVMGGGDVRGCSWAPCTRMEALLTPFALRRAALVTCWSGNLERIVRPMMKPRTPSAVIFGGVDRRLFRHRADAAAIRCQLGLEPDAFVVFSPRLFWPVQNTDVVVAGFARAVTEVPQARLVLVKHLATRYPDYTSGVERQIDALGIRGHVRTLDTIPNTQMPSYYSAADVVVSIPTTDGTPMTVMESFACGTPVVVGDILDYEPDLFRHEKTVLSVPVRDPEALGTALVRMAREPDLRERLVARGLRVVAEHADYESEMARMEALCTDVARGRR